MMTHARLVAPTVLAVGGGEGFNPACFEALQLLTAALEAFLGKAGTQQATLTKGTKGADGATGAFASTVLKAASVARLDATGSGEEDPTVRCMREFLLSQSAVPSHQTGRTPGAHSGADGVLLTLFGALEALKGAATTWSQYQNHVGKILRKEGPGLVPTLADLVCHGLQNSAHARATTLLWPSRDAFRHMCAYAAPLPYAFSSTPADILSGAAVHSCHREHDMSMALLPMGWKSKQAGGWYFTTIVVGEESRAFVGPAIVLQSWWRRRMRTKRRLVWPPSLITLVTNAGLDCESILPLSAGSDEWQINKKHVKGFGRKRLDWTPPPLPIGGYMLTMGGSAPG